MEKEFHSNGKLLLTGEYVVLNGAKALAIPTKYGQNLKIKTSNNHGIHWKSLDEKGEVWFEELFSSDSLLGNDFQNPISQTLSKILKEAKKLNPKFLSKGIGLEVRTELDFSRDWGLGTSSTLINNIAQWAEVNAFYLLSNSFGGSGYDIAAAQHNFPIFYKVKNNRPEIEKAFLNWNFKESLFFVHLNQKQDSKEGIAHYKKTKVEKRVIQRISEIGIELYECKTLKEFEELMKEHERIISKTINLPTIKERLFSDYSGVIKSLGAWGGDFVLAGGTEQNQEYFRKRGYETIINFNEMFIAQ